MTQLEETTFDSTYGLFLGPSVFNDGIAAYPEPIYERSNYSSGVLDHKNSRRIKCLSTNCVYCGAYLALAEMSIALNEKSGIAAAYRDKAETLKANIIRNLYNAEKNTLDYLIDHRGIADTSQEGLGLSFAVLFGIVDGERAHRMVQNAVVSKYGITSITPDFPRYSKEMPGRHNNILWPMVNGFFARAAKTAGNYECFDHEFSSLTHLALDEDKGNYNFREIYNPLLGPARRRLSGLGRVAAELSLGVV